MPEGTIKFFNRAKGFGFIVPDDGDKEVFLPPAAVTGAGAAKLSPGQRVSFEIVADPKGPKAASLIILEGVVPPPKPPQPQMAPRPQHVPVAAPPMAVSLYCDSSTRAAQDVLEALEAQKQPVTVIDMMTAPPTALQLRKWSPVLAEKGQGLVRRSMPLFFDLQLDDRFLHEDEFWTAVVQHPALINGPILTVRERVRICKTAADVKAFFNNDDADLVVAAPKSKNISSRLMAMMRGEAVGPRPPREPEPEYEPEPEDELEPEYEPEAVHEPVEEAPEPKLAKKKAAPAAAKAAKPVAKKPAVKKAVKAAPAKKKAK